MAKKKEKLLKITQVRSLIKERARHKQTVEALGLRRIRHSVTQKDTPQIRGMVEKVRHLVTVEGIK
ncbi:50S ribosomal protein L30 [Candidatus Saccharibacteria bacterium]|nr:50S ribosomal protein L30 [Candidatus Saccharibacteria bacterium]NIV03716.1 50S ribosomal protein L30 [Calditrichia bacterium]NIV72017.1 50S ribosomal protein L30 [Calditrichia bacterium]NIV98850.1 50S ribosomal protein L30 [Candidatus Saccharibacteria bacterium]NIW79127.1 50S ribosomal protein L30 [Calditrichia bacterium]